MGVNFDAGWALIAANSVAIVSTAQNRVAKQAVQYIPDVLEDTGQTSAIPAVAEVEPKAFSGTTGTGLDLATGLYSSVVATKIAVGYGLPVTTALARGEGRFLQTAGTAISDAGRAAERTGMAVRPIGGYVRMLTPPSCSRCAVLAGRRYSSGTAFQRHPRC